MTATETAITVRVTVDGTTVEGRALDLTGDADPETVAAAVSGDDAAGVAVDCPAPRTVHECVGFVRPGMKLQVRTALARAARSRGLTAPQDDDLAAVRDDLASLAVPDACGGNDGDDEATRGPDTTAARRRLAGTETEVARLRERVATLRGRLQAAREAGRETGDLQADLSEATAALSEAETERAAAREALDRAERRAREVRDARDRRRRLQDRAANLERAARAHLVDELRSAYEAALADLDAGLDDPLAADAGDTLDVGPDETPDADSGDSLDADPVAAALAVGRVADLHAPVVLACDRFASPVAAADWLDAPVILV